MILTRFFPPSSGGIESYTSHLAKGLSKDNEVCVLTAGEDFDEIDDIEIYRFKALARGEKSEKDCNLFVKKFKEILINKKIDIVHSHNLLCLSEGESSLIIDVLNKLNIPIIDHCHDGRRANMNPDNINKNFAKIIAVSDFVKSELLSVGYSEKIIEVVHNSVDSEFFDPQKFDKIKAREKFNLPQDKKIILFPSRAIRSYTGKFGEQKNFMTLARSARYIKEKFGDNFLIVFPIVVGSEENIDERKKTLDEFKLFLEEEEVVDNFFTIDRKVNFKEMPFLYKASDIMCTPSENEAFGLVFLEAMSMEIVPIGAKSGGVPEAIKDGKTGFLINPKDYKKLSETIVYLLSNDERRIEMGKACRIDIINNFSFKDMIKKIIGIYDKTIEPIKMGMKGVR